MNLAQELMLPVVSKHAKLSDAANVMKRTNSGAVCVRDKQSVVGLITDRDLVIRALADGGHGLDAPVYELSTKNLVACNSEDSLETAARLMAEHHIRYLVVLNLAGDAVGLLSLEAIAAKGGTQALVGEVVASGHRRNDEQPATNGGATTN